MDLGSDWTTRLATLTQILALSYLVAGLTWVSSTIEISGGEVGLFVILVLIASIGVMGTLLDRESMPIIAGFFLVALSFLYPVLWFVVLPVGFAISGSGIVLSDTTWADVSETADRSPDR